MKSFVIYVDCRIPSVVRWMRESKIIFFNIPLGNETDSLWSRCDFIFLGESRTFPIMSDILCFVVTYIVWDSDNLISLICDEMRVKLLMFRWRQNACTVSFFTLTWSKLRIRVRFKKKKFRYAYVCHQATSLRSVYKLAFTFRWYKH